MSTANQAQYSFVKDQLQVEVYTGREEMGRAAADDVIAEIKRLLAQQESIRMIFAAAPSQNEFLRHLIAEPGIDWSRITAFHMDEYIGLPQTAPQRFAQFLSDALFNRVPFGTVHYLSSETEAELECARYTQLLQAAPIDIVCMGIGENGHIAFNDPPVADFSDPLTVKVVELDEPCRQQQVNDGCFASFADVPTHAMTLTIPALTAGRRLFCIVPGPTKREAVHATLNGPIAESCPASILRRHPACTLYTDLDAYGTHDQ